jgi:glycine/D-amino acid oxidase-like deaminating enzyme
LFFVSVIRLLHPLTPRGKLAYLGLEGLQATKRLIDAASEFKKGVILRDEIFRMALNEDHELALKQAASTLPDWTEWTEASDLEWDTPSSLIGALRIHSGGGKVVHVPTYLQGLWTACKMKGTGKKVWRTEPDFATDGFDWKERLSVFDSVVLCAGSGLFQDSIVTDDMPIQLVRGQSVELFLGDRTLQHARLCGKYASPLPESNRILIGATHEFKSEPLDKSEVETELQKRTNSFASDLWDGSTIDKITTGFRVQSNRGKNGRIPIIGKFKSLLHSDAWIFTGLSSRGLLYHGVFGETLANMILNVECGENSISHDDLEWWLETK